MAPRLVAAIGLAVLLPTTVVGQSDSGVQVYQNVLKATTYIMVDLGGGRGASGSGSLIDRRRGLVLTNYHVVSDIDRATVHFPVYRDGKAIAEKSFYRERARGLRGRVVARDRQADMAVIQLDSVPSGAQALTLAPESPIPGQSVHSIGNPGGSGALWLYTPGRVRQVYQKRWRAKLDERVVTFDAKVIETDSATNRGDSGGPLANDKGELVGVTQGGAVDAQLLSLFIDVTEVQRFLNTQSVRAVRPLPGAEEVPATRAGFAVRDGAKFFSVSSVASANEEIKRLAHRFGRDLLIETHPTVPAEDVEKVRGMTRPEREAYFTQWAKKRAVAEKVTGVVILITREPSYLLAATTPDAEKVFDDAAEGRLRDVLLAKFRERKYDDGLLAAVKLVADKFAEQKP